MKFLFALTLLGTAQAVLTETKNGVTYTVTYTKNGIKLPVVPGPKFSFSSRDRKSAGSRRLSKTLKRDQTSNNWCGVANTNAPGGTWSSVSGGWSVPQISLRSGQSPYDQPSIAQWVGIDGDGCGTGLIQGGTLSQLNSDGSQTNAAWFEFVPNPLSTFQMNGKTVTNESNGESMNMEITDGPGTLCGYSAEWIFEDLTGGNGLEPFAEFPSNEFSNCQAETTTGQSGGT
ncbi:hypothetical protein NLG97_g445 [Lecanicillium saksenae]|uniref:Uncharacterized protein n=1 Tax=Lecanicillium saksenae TaxID=468837 RepID=A0ACC1R951_9HYPO|nr:hypothetical protein NLG97_g445 [Lecanicillium saksenae]